MQFDYLLMYSYATHAKEYWVFKVMKYVDLVNLSIMHHNYLRIQEPLKYLTEVFICCSNNNLEYIRDPKLNIISITLLTIISDSIVHAFLIHDDMDSMKS